MDEEGDIDCEGGEDVSRSPKEFIVEERVSAIRGKEAPLSTSFVSMWEGCRTTETWLT